MKKILYILICLWCVNAYSTPLSSLSDTIQICDTTFIDTTVFTQNEKPSWKRLGMHTGMFVGCGVVTLVTLELLPENATAWNKTEIKNTPLFTRYANHFKKGPVIDHDRLTFNYILHPYAGAVYYNAARGAGFNRWQSFLFSTFVSNVLWEYGIECFNEIPSIQDLLITPVVGSLVGGGWFIVGVDTPEGQYTYHYEAKYWDMFDCIELDAAPDWDGHTDNDVTRLLSLVN